MKRCLKNNRKERSIIRKILNKLGIFFLPFLLLCLCIPIHVNAISTDDLDKSGDIGYVRMKIFVEETPKEILVEMMKEDTGEIIELYTYPQYDYIIDATLPIGTYTIKEVKCEENLEFDVDETFTIEKNGVAAVKIPQSNVIFDDFNEPLSSDGIGTDIALLNGDHDNEIALYEETGNDVVQPRVVDDSETSSHTILEDNIEEITINIEDDHSKYMSNYMTKIAIALVCIALVSGGVIFAKKKK